MYQKKARGIAKKLRQIAELKERRAHGFLLQSNQIGKISSEAEVRRELEEARRRIGAAQSETGSHAINEEEAAAQQAAAAAAAAAAREGLPAEAAHEASCAAHDAMEHGATWDEAVAAGAVAARRGTSAERCGGSLVMDLSDDEDPWQL